MRSRVSAASSLDFRIFRFSIRCYQTSNKTARCEDEPHRRKLFLRLVKRAAARSADVNVPITRTNAFSQLRLVSAAQNEASASAAADHDFRGLTRGGRPLSRWKSR